MSLLSAGVGAAALSPSDTFTGTSSKASAAAKDFEALMLGQMLRSARQDKSWLSIDGSEDDSVEDTTMSIGEQELAKTLAAHGGLGLSKMISTALACSADAPGSPNQGGAVPTS